MIDLVRLMHDDGATRKPIDPIHLDTGAIPFTWRGRQFVGKLWTKETFGTEDRTINAWFFTDSVASDREKIENFLKDPNWWASTFSNAYRTLPGWGRPRTVYGDDSWAGRSHLLEIIEIIS